jgi:drug/metabolite transporter (DMT)-like permease
MPKFRSRWKEFLIVGATNSAIPFTLIAAAEIELTASLAAILNSTTALFVAVVAAVWIGESLTVKKVVGLLLGFAGVVVLVGWDPVPLTAPCCWRLGRCSPPPSPTPWAGSTSSGPSRAFRRWP